jgi:hypothetical protein
MYVLVRAGRHISAIFSLALAIEESIVESNVIVDSVNLLIFI